MAESTGLAYVLPQLLPGLGPGLPWEFFSVSGSGIPPGKKNIILVLWAAKESDETCRNMILEGVNWVKRTTGFYQHEPPCLHKDQLDVIQKGAFDPGSSFVEKVASIDKCCFRREAWCHTHRRSCCLWEDQPPCDIFVAGFPCQDHARCGSQLHEEGPTAPTFIAAAKYHIERGTKVLVLENVSDC